LDHQLLFLTRRDLEYPPRHYFYRLLETENAAFVQTTKRRIDVCICGLMGSYNHSTPTAAATAAIK
jgi:hypothetical protein